MSNRDMEARECFEEARECFKGGGGHVVRSPVTFVGVQLSAGLVVVEVHPHVVAAGGPPPALRAVRRALHHIGRLRASSSWSQGCCRG